MDTPDRKKAGGSPISKFEDSPGFSYFNTLSPIPTVKSVYSTQTFQSLSFATIASVFSSPDVQEPNFLKRNPFTDLIKEDTFSHNLNGSSSVHVVSNVDKLSTCEVLPQEDSDIICSLNEATIDPPDECSTQSERSQSMHCTNGSPTHNDRPLCGIKFDFESDISSRTSELVQFVQDGLGNKNNLVSSEISLNVNIQEDQKKNVASGCDWKNLASADDLIILDKEMIEKNHNSISLNTQPNASFSICIQNNPDDSLVDNDGKAGEQPGMNRAAKLLSDNSFHQEKFSEQNQKADAGVTACVYLGCKINSQPARGMRRRCLVFEASGNSERNLRNDSTAIPPITLLTKERPTSDDQLLASSNPCLLPGIGLHLNALASSSKDKLYFPENKIPVREIICKPCSGCPFPPAEVGEKSKIFELEQTTDPLGREAEDFQVVHSDVLQTPAPPVEESTCPRKKRRKIGNGSDSEGCKNCCCKKSKCLKLYCECFAAGTYCVEPCLCQGCFNKPIHEEIVLATRKQIESRNPLAFAPKVIRTFEDGQDMEEETNKTPASARHKKGCNCKKSNCLKKYCECYQGGVGCSSSCRCESCRNTFGRKDGVDEVECDGEIVDCAKVKLNEGQNNADIPKIEGCHLSEGTLAKTLFLTSRSSIRYASLSSENTPQTSILSQMHNKSENQQSHCKSRSNIQISREDDTPEILRSNSSPYSAMKVLSPNGKRVSPPHNGLGMSPYCKGGRRLILKSIPSFPCLSGNALADTTTSFSSSHFNPRTLR